MLLTAHSTGVVRHKFYRTHVQLLKAHTVAWAARARVGQWVEYYAMPC